MTVSQSVCQVDSEEEVTWVVLPGEDFIIARYLIKFCYYTLSNASLSALLLSHSCVVGGCRQVPLHNTRTDIIISVTFKWDLNNNYDIRN